MPAAMEGCNRRRGQVKPAMAITESSYMITIR